MLVKEYRICMPLTVEEYRIGQLYTISKHSHQESDTEEGIEVILNERHCDPTHGQGQHTEKRIHLSREYTCSFLPKFSIHIETKYENNCGTNDNIFGLEKDSCAAEVDVMDIAYDEFPERHYNLSEDPRCFSSVKTGRGPLQEGWRQSSSPIMCSYKLVRVQFEVWGLQTRVEQFIQKVIRDVLLVGHRQAFAWVDEWYSMNLEDVRRFEDEMHVATNQKIGCRET